MRAPDVVPRPAHGGDLAAVAARYGVDPATLLDFSSNVDPYGPPAAVRAAIARVARSPRELARYPEPTSRALREAIAQRHAVDPVNVIVANGSAAIFDAIVRAIVPDVTVVPVPAFSEYRRAIDAAGSHFDPHPLDASFDWNDEDLLEQIERSGATLLMLTNPHNPSGRLFTRSHLASLAEACARLGCAVSVDEAFIDYAEEESLAGAPRENLVVVRSLTKLFGMAGIRIGYAVATESVAAAIASRLASWPVGAVDSAAAAAALGERNYAERVLRRNERERKRLATALERAGIAVFPSAANFLLLELPCAASALGALLERLVQTYGIVVRDCRSYDGLRERSLIRVAVRKRSENARLIEALSTACSRSSTNLPENAAWA